jgi:hypothetical protein
MLILFRKSNIKEEIVSNATLTKKNKVKEGIVSIDHLIQKK